MAMNPMQRKTRNAFLFGFIIALIIGGVVIALLFMKIKSLNEAKLKIQEEAKIAMGTVYVMNDGAEKNEYIADKITTKQVPMQLIPKNAITPDKIDYYRIENPSEALDVQLSSNYGDLTDSEIREMKDFENYKDFIANLEKEAEENNTSIDEYPLAIKSRIPLTEGTILTSDMVVRSNVASTYRKLEYTMISLPSMLVAGDYIDIRIAFPEGTNFVVLSKVKVEECNATTIWITLNESDMLKLNSAIVESYIIEGTKLYATQYLNEAQADLNSTYIPNSNVISLMDMNSNATEADILNELKSKLRTSDSAESSYRNYINGYVNNYNSNEQVSKVKEGYQAEKTTIQAARSALLGEAGY